MLLSSLSPGNERQAVPSSRSIRKSSAQHPALWNRNPTWASWIELPLYHPRLVFSKLNRISNTPLCRAVMKKEFGERTRGWAKENPPRIHRRTSSYTAVFSREERFLSLLIGGTRAGYSHLWCVNTNSSLSQQN